MAPRARTQRVTSVASWYPRARLDRVEAENPDLLAHYEGLVIRTSIHRKYEGIKRWDTEEVRQILRVKVWKALLSWAPHTDARTQRRIAEGVPEQKLRDAYVFGCVTNQMKDLLKRDRERELFVEDLSENDPTFEARYLHSEFEATTKAVTTTPLIPNTLSLDERYVLLCAYNGYNGPQTAERLGMTRGQVAMHVREIREKMRDWRPKKTPDPEVTPSPARAIKAAA
jgi:DNA-directed RNA polymerase specialized sigma24 family protein